MTVPDLDKRALAAGLVTDTLSEAEVIKAEALMRSDMDFADLVRVFRDTLSKEGDASLPERVWLGIERRLTGYQN
jgi:anti-sigma-K factor RskA